jgi:hypothetical protein
MADATQMRAVNRAIEELRARIVDARTAYGEIPAVRRLVNDVERLSIAASELDLASDIAPPPAASFAATKIGIDDTPPDPAMWRDADDEGVGGFHGPNGSSTGTRR